MHCLLDYALFGGGFEMNTSVIDFAETYSKMSDEQLSIIFSDEKSLVDAARIALHAEMQRRSYASQAQTTDAVA